MVDKADASAYRLAILGNQVAVVDALFDDASRACNAGQVTKARIGGVVDVVAVVDAAQEFGVAVTRGYDAGHTTVVAGHIAVVDAVREVDRVCHICIIRGESADSSHLDGICVVFGVVALVNADGSVVDEVGYIGCLGCCEGHTYDTHRHTDVVGYGSVAVGHRCIVGDVFHGCIVDESGQHSAVGLGGRGDSDRAARIKCEFFNYCSICKGSEESPALSGC